MKYRNSIPHDLIITRAGVESVSRVRETSAGVLVTNMESVGLVSSAPLVTGVRCPGEIILSLCRGRHRQTDILLVRLIYARLIVIFMQVYRVLVHELQVF